jgi:hypothetical protein
MKFKARVAPNDDWRDNAMMAGYAAAGCDDVRPVLGVA